MADDFFTFVFDIQAERVDDIIQLDVKDQDGKIIERRVRPSKVSTVEKAALWLLYQQFQERPTDTTINKRLTVTAHESVQSSSDGSFTIWVIDDIQVEPLAQDRGRDEFNTNLPSWATWTAQEAADWIDTNVTDLASAKVALTQMARAIVALRDYTGVVE